MTGIGSAILLAIGLVFTPLAAPPNFSGHWVIDQGASDLAGSSSGWFGNDMQVTQDDRTITFGTLGSGPGVGSSTFQLDGTPTKRDAGRGSSRETTARWDKERLSLISRITSARIDPATNKLAVTELTVTVQLDKTGALVVDAAYSPPLTSGKYAKHTAYRKK
jgi:hypothetical protein